MFWNSFVDFVEDEVIDPISDIGGPIIENIGDGAVRIWRDADGVIHTTVDFSRTTAEQAAGWAQQVAGDAVDFSMATYLEARDWAVDNWQAILAMAMTSPPRLGPPNDAARLAMRAVLGAGMANTIVDAWARDAINKGYTLAINFRGTLTAGTNGTAYSGIYVDNQGKWGFFAEIGAGYSPIPSLDAAIGIEVWMMFGDRGDFDRKYFMPGLTLNFALPGGGEVSAGANALINGSFAFKGFRIHTNVSLVPSQSPVMPDAGPTQSNLAALGIAQQAPSYDAAVQTARNPGAEASIVTNAMGSNALPAAQDQWRWCSRCMALFYGGPGVSAVCPHGGAHSASGSGNYVLYYNAAPQQPGVHQNQWRWCRKCGGMHYTGLRLGKCPADGQPHATEGSGAYFIPHSTPDRPNVQSNWRWCEHCQGLWWAGNPSQSRCPATGGPHSANGSGNYVLNQK